jgi:hypothetical protein
MPFGFSVTETFTNLINIPAMLRDNFFHPYFRRWNKPKRILFLFASVRMQAFGLENFKAGFGD